MRSILCVAMMILSLTISAQSSETPNVGVIKITETSQDRGETVVFNHKVNSDFSALDVPFRVLFKNVLIHFEDMSQKLGVSKEYRELLLEYSQSGTTKI